MIVRVCIENLVIVDHAEFEPGPGLTVVTGETGAGKTLLAGAIGLLFGADADAAQVGPGADHAWIEGEFEVEPSFWHHPSVAVLAELRPEGEDRLVLARKVGREGRSRALAWGRTVAKGDLAAAGTLLVATAGQHAHRRLLMPSYQRDLLDAFGREAHAPLVRAMEDAWNALEAARREHERIQEEATRLLAHADQVHDDLARIDAVDPSVEDELELRAQRDRVRHRTRLFEGLSRAAAALDADGRGAVDALGEAWAATADLTQVDPALAGVAETLLALQSQANDAASELRAGLEELQEAPGSIDGIEDRLSAYDELHRRFGGTTEAVLDARQRLRDQVRLVSDGSGALERAANELAELRAHAAAAAARLRAGRQRLAGMLEDAVRGQLVELGMSDSVVEVDVAEAPLSSRGTDRVELRIAPGDHVEPRPIAQVASGGELSRIALALHVASGASEAGTILFDEIDAGIGGHTAHAIASKLRELAEVTQVICISHLAQVAARAQTHVHIAKHEGRTTLTRLEDESQVLDELVRMMGAGADDPAARQTARGLRGPRSPIQAKVPGPLRAQSPLFHHAATIPLAGKVEGETQR